MAAINVRVEPSFSDLKGRLERAKLGIRRANVKSVKGATLAGQRFARSIAPVKTGELKAGIIRKPVVVKKKVVSSALISVVPDRGWSKSGLPGGYNWWVNENVKSIRLFGRGRPRTYRSTRNTGVPGYFRLTAKYVSQIFPKFAIREINRELKTAMKS